VSLPAVETKRPLSDVRHAASVGSVLGSHPAAVASAASTAASDTALASLGSIEGYGTNPRQAEAARASEKVEQGGSGGEES
jgi:hypothetical protein